MHPSCQIANQVRNYLSSTKHYCLWGAIRPRQAFRAVAKHSLSCLVVAALTSGCSGGGGGGEGGGSRERSTDTAVRIIHGAVDKPPVDLTVDGLFVESARFGEATDYVAVPEGAHSFSLAATNSPQTVLSTLPVTLNKDTEYSLLLYGKEENESYNAVIIPDQVVRPEKGFASVRVVHSVAAQSPLTVTANTTPLPQTAFGQASPFTTIPSGATQFVVRNRDGGTVATAATTIEDRAEVTVVVTGDQALGAYFVTLFNDLD
jgi:hypothetical protein